MDFFVFLLISIFSGIYIFQFFHYLYKNKKFNEEFKEILDEIKKMDKEKQMEYAFRLRTI